MFETPPVGFLRLWPHLCYPCVFEFPDARCQLWSPLSDSLLPAPQERAVGRKHFKFLAGMTGFRWAGAPSYTKITSSSGLVLACARKLSKREAFNPPRAAEENTSPLIGKIAIVTVKFRPRWPDTWRYALSPCRALPAFVDKHTVAHYGMVHKPGGVIHSLVRHIRSVSVRREGPCKFHSEKHPV